MSRVNHGKKRWLPLSKTTRTDCDYLHHGTQKMPLLAMRTGGVEFLRKPFDTKLYLNPFEWRCGGLIQIEPPSSGRRIYGIVRKTSV